MTQQAKQIARPEPGFMRLKQIVPALIPVSPSTWWAGCRSGKYPRPLKLSPNVTVWRRSEILALMDKFEEAAG